jgi:hypothetical protein
MISEYFMLFNAESKKENLSAAVKEWFQTSKDGKGLINLIWTIENEKQFIS